MSKLDTTYTFMSRDAGAPNTGGSPTFLHLKKMDGNDFTPQPTIFELGNGVYKFAIDWSLAPLQGDISYVIDMGAGITDDGERYIRGLCELSKLEAYLTLHLNFGRALLDDSSGALNVYEYDPTQPDPYEGVQIGSLPVFESGAEAYDSSSTKITDRKPLDIT